MNTAPQAPARFDTSLMQLMWLASPALPIGGFAYSEGLEAYIHHQNEAAQVATNRTAAANADDTSRWLQDQLHLSFARSDLAVVAQAIPAWRDPESAGLTRLRALNAWVLETRETSELRAQTEQMGRSLLEWLRNHNTAPTALIKACSDFSPSYPIAFALAAASTEASARDCLVAYAFGWAENMVQAAIKAVPLGQSAGQRILAALVQQIPLAIDQALTRVDIDERQAFSPMLAILSAQHETQYSRLFRS